MKRFSALIADIENSRAYEIEERISIQRRLEASIRFLNELHGGGVAVSAAFSGGDEIQGLFLNTATAFLYFRELSILMAPVKMRGGIGVGGWEINIEGEPSPVQDGTAYHCARAAAEEAKASRLYRLVIWGNYESSELTVLAGYAIGICCGRSKKQEAVARLVELCRPLVASPVLAVGSAGRELEEARARLLNLFLEGDRTAYDAWRRAGVLSGSDFPDGAVENVDVRCRGGDSWPTESLRGLSYRLASVEGFMSRSSIDRLIGSGCVLEERNAAALMVRWCQGGEG